MNSKLKLGYSTCPNDTFIFYALAHNKIDVGGLEFDIRLKDVEALNQDARRGFFDISKLSFAAFGHLQDTYGLLRSGAALGRGCGPLIVAREGYYLGNLPAGKIAIPGEWTTANLLLKLFIAENFNRTEDSRQLETVPMVFDEIMPALQNKEVAYGVIIHEGRFTYPQSGLVQLVDLGEWWEEFTNLPIPLGGIAVRRNLPPNIIRSIETAVRDSVNYAFTHQGAADTYIRRYAQEMDADVIRRHIELYVNDFSLDLGQEGAKAVETLFKMARDRHILPPCDIPLFAC